MFLSMKKKKGTLKVSAVAAKGAIRAAHAPIPIEDDERYRDQVDDYVTRNRDALNASIKKSRAEIASGKASTKTVSKIIAEARRRHNLANIIRTPPRG
jgi:hypothetical protein